MSPLALILLLAASYEVSGLAIGSGAVPCSTCSVPVISPPACSTCGVPVISPPACNTCGSPIYSPPAQGVWGAWGPWGPCVYQYGAYSQTRQRACSSSSCPGGDAEEARACTVQQDQPAPQWNSWGAWSSCSASCGGGSMTRQRTCNTQCGVCSCQGSSSESQSCNTQSCCEWGGWAPWSECSVTCGSGGFRTRNRICSCTACPSGEPSEAESCSGAYSCPTTCSTCGTPVYSPPVYSPPAPCTTCQQYSPPVISPPACSTCGSPIYSPAPAPIYSPPVISPPACSTCGVPVISPPACSTCGVAQGLPSVYSAGQGGTFYDPYSNGRRKRQLGSIKSLRETLIGQVKNVTKPAN